MDTNDGYKIRGTYQYRLAAAWVKLNRPDVWEAIQADSFVKYPGKKRPRIELPSAIASIPAFGPRPSKAAKQ